MPESTRRRKPVQLSVTHVPEFMAYVDEIAEARNWYIGGRANRSKVVFALLREEVARIRAGIKSSAPPPWTQPRE